MTMVSRNPIDQPPRTSFLLVRHGQTEWNTARRFLGRTDIPLDPQGHRQAAQVARLLSQHPVNQIVTSPLQRASQTASAIAAYHPSVSMQQDDAWMEILQGELEGTYGKDFQRLFPEFYRAWRSNPATAQIPGGETLRQCQERAVTALQGLATSHPLGSSMIVVTHKMLLSSLFCALLDLPLKHYSLIDQVNTAVNLVSWDGKRFHVEFVNQGFHLGLWEQ